VRFFQTGDRYSHVIELDDGGHVRTLLESVEGSEQDYWPPSPPLQHLNVSWITSDSEHRHVAMLVGGAGSSHWSMCVAVSDLKSRPRENRGDPNTELTFDIACRVQKPPAWLGSTYRILAAPAVASEKLNCACIPVTPPRCLVLTDDIALQMDTRSRPLPLLRCRANAFDGTLFDLPATVRWRYSVRWLSQVDDDFEQIVLDAER
jgi:hypothetical protein